MIKCIMKHTFVIGLIATVGGFLAGCGNTNSGPCDYDIKKFKATITGIEGYVENGDSLFHIIVEFDVSTLAHAPQRMDELREIKVDRGMLSRNPFRIGTIYTGTVSEKLTGECVSPIISFDQKIH